MATITTSGTVPISLDVTGNNPLTIAGTVTVASTDVGVAASSVAGALTNRGSILATTAVVGTGDTATAGGVGVQFQAGGTITNQVSAVVFGAGSGITVGSKAGRVSNYGTVSGPGHVAVALDDGGSVTNTGSILGAEDGVRVLDALGTVTNSAPSSRPAATGSGSRRRNRHEQQ